MWDVEFSYHLAKQPLSTLQIHAHAIAGYCARPFPTSPDVCYVVQRELVR